MKPDAKDPAPEPTADAVPSAGDTSRPGGEEALTPFQAVNLQFDRAA
jgi:hypothetical protein